MKEASRDFIVGLMSIGGMISFALLLMFFGELDTLFNPRYELTIRTHNAMGLRSGGGVEHDGVPVGVIHEVIIEQNPDFPVRIVALINEEVTIPSNVEPFAASPLIGGSARLQLLTVEEVSMPQAPPFTKDGSAVIVGVVRGGIVEQIADQLDQQMQPIESALESFGHLSDSIIDLSETLNELLQPQTTSDINSATGPNLRTAIVKLNQTLDEVRESFSLVRDWAGDDELRLGAREAIIKFTTAADRFTQLADSLDARTDQLTRALLPVADELAITLEEIRLVAKLANEGDGTVGQLLNNPDLYNSLDDAAVRLDRTLVELQMLIEKIKAEGVNINY